MSTEELAMPGLPSIMVPLTVSNNADLFFDPRGLAHVFSLVNDKPANMLDGAFGRRNKIAADHPEWKRGELGGWPEDAHVDVSIFGPASAQYVDSATVAHMVHHYIDSAFRDDTTRRFPAAHYSHQWMRRMDQGAMTGSHLLVVVFFDVQVINFVCVALSRLPHFTHSRLVSSH
jgi:hypothetical protein